MWVIYLIAAAFFVACLAAGYFAVAQREEERRALGPSGRAPPDDGRGRELSADELVLRLERRIDADIRDISYDVQTPERHRRVYEQ